MSKQKLLKQFLPMILSLALILGDMPLTALAAEDPAVDETVISEEVVSGDDVLDLYQEAGGEVTLPKAVIRVDETAIKEWAVDHGYDFDYINNAFEADYIGEDMDGHWDSAADVLTAVKRAITVENVPAKPVEKDNKLSYKWKVYDSEKNDFVYLENDGDPCDAGQYKLEVSREAEENVSQASDPVIAAGLTIRKAKLTFHPQTKFDAGVTVGEVKAANAYSKIALDRSDDPNPNPDRPPQKDMFVTSLSVSVTDTADAVVEDNISLSKDKNYYLVLNIELYKEVAQNYEVEQSVFPILFGGSVKTWVELTYADASKPIEKIYDGKEVKADELVLPALSSQKVFYTDTEGVDRELADAKLEGIWCDANGKPYQDKDFLPTDAGVYFYRLKYTDPSGAYADSYTDVRVVVKMADIVIDPLFVAEAGASPSQTLEVYEGMRVKDVLNKVDYKVYPASDEAHSSPLDIDEYFWGIYTDAGRTMYYQPVFAVQRGEEIAGADGTTETVWTTVTDETKKLIKEGKYTYRVVFSGKKAVFSPGGAKLTSDINGAQKNYHVNTTDASIAKCAKALTVKDSIYLATKVDKILVENKGGTFEEPIVKSYDGKGIYANKGEYKKAEVTVSSGNASASVPENAVSMLDYSWQRVSEWIVKTDAKGNKTEIVTEDCWEDVGPFHDVDKLCSPMYSGVYRLKIEINDPEGLYVSDPSYVYYVVKPKDILLQFHITNTELPDTVDYGKINLYIDGTTTVKEFVSKLQNKNPNDAATYINPEFLYISELSQDEAGNVKLVPGEPVKNDPDFEYSYELNSIITRMFEDPAKYFSMEYMVLSGDHRGEWRACRDNDRFRNGNEYRISVNFNEINAGVFEETGFVYNHNFGQKPGIFNHSVLKEGISYYGYGFARVVAKESKNIITRINYDSTQPITTVKTYDAKPYDLSEVKKLVKVVDAENNDVTDKVKIIYEYEEVKTGSSAAARIGETACLHAGTYRLYVRTLPDENYLAADAVKIADIKVRQKVAEVKPLLSTDIKAGTKIDEDVYKYIFADPDDIEKCYEIAGLLEQEPDIGHVRDDFDVFGVYEKLSDKPLPTDYRLKSGQEYYVKVQDEFYGFIWNGSRLDETYDPIKPVSYSRDYELKFVPAAFTASPVASGIRAEGVRLTHITELQNGVFVHRISPTAGVSVPYDYTRKGNFLQFRLYAPVEYQGQKRSFDNLGFVYRESIKSAKGELEIDDGYDSDEQLSYIVVSFDASLGGAHEFVISWKGTKEKYIVDLDNTMLQADLSVAVAPKAIAFVPKTVNMVVGGTQQLDVKITKKRKDDVICLDYVSSDESVLRVNGSGFVTALKKGTAKVTVFPCRMVNGEKQRITDKGVKAATATVKVKDVAKPSGLKLTVADTYVQVRYKKPANGYRREIYVLEGKKKEADFQSAINSVRNGDYTSVFAAAPVFVNAETTDAKGIVTRSAGGLAPMTTYTVYLRNVSAPSIMEDSTKVTLSSSGVVKTFTTTRSQALSVRTSLNAADNENIEKCDETYYGLDYYKVAMKLGTVQLKTEGRFLEKYSKDYSDAGDYIWLELPLSKDDQKSYAAPKMSYYAYSYKSYDYNDSGKVKGSVLYYNSYNYMPTSIASVDKNGKITLKGRGIVHILAIDNNKMNSYDIVLKVTAEPTKVEGKNVTMQVGEKIWLSNYLVYYEGNSKNKLTWEDSVLSVAEQSDENFEITRTTDGNYTVTALKAGQSLTLHVTDSEVKKAGGADAQIRITTKEMAAVKSPKKAFVADEQFTVEYTYPFYNMDLRWEIRDAGDRLIDGGISALSAVRYDTKKKAYVFNKTFTGLRRLTTYNLKLEAIYENPATKEITASKKVPFKVTTTNIPVSLYDLASNQYNMGEDISVTTVVSSSTAAGKSAQATYLLSNSPVLKAGNSYTLSLDTYNPAAKERMSDKVTWKSKNTKVATVKVLPGTYSATLKAVKSGDTTIELVSKITKKVIARWKITVAAVGDADDYFGDYEPYTRLQYTSANEREVLQFAVGSPLTVTLNKMEAQWFVYTAPSYGYYSFQIDRRDGSGLSASAYFVDSRESVGSDGKVPGKIRMSSYDRFMEKGAKLYVYLPADEKMTARISVTGDQYQDVVLGENIVRGNQNIRLIATEDNYYTFSIKENDKSVVITRRSAEKGESVMISNIGSGSDKEYILNVTKRTPAVLPEKDGAEISLAKGEELWYVFQAEEGNIYNFLTTETTKNVTIEIFESLRHVTADDSYVNSTGDMALEKGDKIYLRLTSGDAVEEEPVKAVLKAEKKREVKAALELGGTGNAFTLSADTPVWYSFTAEEAGMYRFAFSTGAVSVEYFHSLADEYADVVYGELSLKKGESIYLRLKAAAEVSGTLTVTRRNLNTQVELKADGNLVSVPKIEAQNELWLKFSADEYNSYSFTLTGIKASAMMSLYDDLEDMKYIVQKDAGTEQCVISDIVLSRHQSVYIRINASIDAEDALKLKIAKIVPEPLALDGVGSYEFDAAGEVKWFEFKTDELNYYSFFYNFESGNAQAEIYDRFINAAPANRIYSAIWAQNGSPEVKFEAGRKLYLKLTALSVAKGEVKIRKRVLEGALSETEDNKLTLAQTEPKWYKINSDDINYITLKVSATAPVSLYIYDDILDSEWSDRYGRYDDITASEIGIPFVEPGVKYIRLLNSGKDASELTLAVTRRNLESAELIFDRKGEKGTDIKLSGKKEKWYAFTAPESNVYTFYADNVAGGAVTAELYSNMSDANTHQNGYSDSGATSSFKITSIAIDKGKKVYLRFIPAADADITFTVKIGRRVPDDLVPDTDITKNLFTITDSGEHWYVLTAGDREGDTDRNYTYTFYPSLVDSNESATFGVYHRLNDPTANETLDTSKFKSKDYTRVQGGKIYLMVTVPNATTSNPIKIHIGVDECPIDADGLTDLKLETGGYAKKFSITYKKETWFKFTAPEDNYYVFSADKYVKIESYNFSGHSSSVFDNGSSRPMLKDDVICFRMYDPTLKSDDAAKEVTLTIKRREVVATPLSLDTSGTAIAFTAGVNELWYELKADADNCYTVYSDTVPSDGSTVTVDYFNAITSPEPTYTAEYAGSKLEMKEVSIKKDASGYVRISRAGGTGDITVNLKVRKRTVAATNEINTLGSVDLDIAAVQTGQNGIWYQFKAPAEHNYTVLLEDVAAGSITAECFAGLADPSATKGSVTVRSTDTEQTGAISNEIHLKANEVIYLRVGLASGTTAPATGKLTIKQRTAESDFIKADDYTPTITLNSGETKYYVFTSTEGRWYSVSANDLTGTVRMDVFTDLAATDDDIVCSESSIGSDTSCSVGPVYVAIGSKIYVRLTTSSGTATCKLRAVHYEDVLDSLPDRVLSVDSSARISSSEGSTTDTWYQFTAPASVNYEITMQAQYGEGGRKLSLYTEMTSKTVSDPIEITSGEKSLTISATAGKKYFLRFETTGENGFMMTRIKADAVYLKADMNAALHTEAKYNMYYYTDTGVEFICNEQTFDGADPPNEIGTRYYIWCKADETPTLVLYYDHDGTDYTAQTSKIRGKQQNGVWIFENADVLKEHSIVLKKNEKIKAVICFSGVPGDTAPASKACTLRITGADPTLDN